MTPRPNRRRLLLASQAVGKSLDAHGWAAVIIVKISAFVDCFDFNCNELPPHQAQVVLGAGASSKGMV